MAVEEHIRAGFTRSRRFLVAISLGLTLFYAVGLKVNHVSILGNDAEIERPEAVQWLVWIVWAWALAQYVVWFHDVEAWSEFQAAARARAVRTLAEDLTRHPLPEWLQQSLHTDVTNRSGEPIAGYTASQQFVRLRPDGKADIEGSAIAYLSNEKGEVTAGPVRFVREVDLQTWRSNRRVAYIYVMVTSRYFVEYFAPFVIAAIPVFWRGLPYARDAAVSALYWL
jgi:hypothetical protein